MLYLSMVGRYNTLLTQDLYNIKAFIVCTYYCIIVFSFVHELF